MNTKRNLKIMFVDGSKPKYVNGSVDLEEGVIRFEYQMELDSFGVGYIPLTFVKEVVEV